MANNRVYLVCNVCWPDPNKDWPSITSNEFKAFFHLAKWYPGEIGQWYTNRPETIGQSLDEFLEQHAHPDKYPGGVENPVRLEYEWEGTPEIRSKMK